WIESRKDETIASVPCHPTNFTCLLLLVSLQAPVPTMAQGVIKGVKDWWLGTVNEHSPDQELTDQFSRGIAPDTADLIRFDDGQTEVDSEFMKLYASNRPEDPKIEAYFDARDAYEQHEGVWSKLRTRLPYYVPI